MKLGGVSVWDPFDQPDLYRLGFFGVQRTRSFLISATVGNKSIYSRLYPKGAAQCTSFKEGIKLIFCCFCGLGYAYHFTINLGFAFDSAKGWVIGFTGHLAGS